MKIRISDALLAEVSYVVQYVVYETRELNDNETGVNYGDLFGRYLLGSSEIIISEPYIRRDFQIKNLRQFIDDLCELESNLKFTLITLESGGWNNDYTATEQKERLDELVSFFKAKGISLNIEINRHTKTRRITSDLGVMIHSDRGLHLYKPPVNDEESDNYNAKRCNKTEINYISPVHLIPVVEEPMVLQNTTEGAVASSIEINNITENDVDSKKIRIKQGNKHLFPQEIVGEVKLYILIFNYNGSQYDAVYRIGSKDGHVRSGVLRLGRDLFEEVGIQEGTCLSLQLMAGGIYELSKL